MQKKPKKRFLDVQIVIATIAMTVTISLWNILASAARQTSSASIAEKFANERISKNPDQSSSLSPAAPAATSTPGLSFIQLPPVKMLLGGKMPVARVIVSSSSGSSTSSGGSSSSGGGTTGSKPPPPVTTTSSSHK